MKIMWNIRNKYNYVGDWAVKSIKCEAIPAPVNVNSVQNQPQQMGRMERTGHDPRFLGEAPDTIMRAGNSPASKFKGICPGNGPPYWSWGQSSARGRSHTERNEN